jgi:hypothetical protein
LKIDLLPFTGPWLLTSQTNNVITVFANVMAARMDINCASARHLEAFADIPQELADKVVAYRKIRKRIFHIDEIYRIGGISRKYFSRLTSVFYVPNQVVPRIGAQLPYNNALSIVFVQQKHQNRNANLKKRTMKIKKSENQRKIENRDRKRKLKRERVSTQYKPLGNKCNLYSTNMKRLNTQNVRKKVQKKEVEFLIDRNGKYQCLRRRKTTDIEQSSVQSSESNINERVAGLLAATSTSIPKLEVGDIDMEGDNKDMEEILAYRKRPYRCVKRPETTDTENSSVSSESIPSLASAIVQRANINEREDRLLAAVPNFEGDNKDMEGDIETEEENILTYRKRPYLWVDRPETTNTEQSSESSESAPSTRRLNINERVARLLSAVHKLECDNIDMEKGNMEMEEDNIDMEDNIDLEEDNIPTCSKRPEYSSDSSHNSSDSSHYNSDSSEHSSDSSQYSSDSSQHSSDSSQHRRHSSDSSQHRRQSSGSSHYSSDSSQYSSDSLEHSNDSSQYSSDSSHYSSDSSQHRRHSSDSSQYSSYSLENSNDSSQYSSDSSQHSSDSSQYSSDSSQHSSYSLQYSSDSSQNSSDSVGAKPSVVVQRGNINERVARLLAAVPTLEGDNMEMEEDNSFTNRKRKYQSVKRQETTDTDQRSKYSVSVPASVIEQEYNDTMKMVARWIPTIPKFEGDTMEMEEDNIKIEEDNIKMEEDNIPRDEDMCTSCYTHIRM